MPQDDLASDYDYDLPAASIAQVPPRRRDQCRLVVVNRAEPKVEHHHFRHLLKVLKKGDLLVLNNSKVLPARVPCHRHSGGKVEAFLLEPLASKTKLPAFVKPAGRLKKGEALIPDLDPDAGRLVLGERGNFGVHHLAWQAGTRPWGPRLLQRIGLTPLPPYITRASQLQDRHRYQTSFAKVPGSVAAPTAGLHFTPGLLKTLQAQGVKNVSVTLHVGAGTFQPVKTEILAEHVMHQEAYEVPSATLKAIQRCRAQGGRVIAVGTTALRALESAAQHSPSLTDAWAETRLFIRPGYRFKVVDGLITNFHQPRSTLLALVSAFWDRQKLLSLYSDCLSKGYLFLSYGDACIFL